MGIAFFSPLRDTGIIPALIMMMKLGFIYRHLYVLMSPVIFIVTTSLLLGKVGVELSVFSDIQSGPLWTKKIESVWMEYH